MSASGQMPSDYGEHWSPEAVWSDYDLCLDCGAESGKPCWDLRVKLAPRKPTWRPHPSRTKVDAFPPPGRYPATTVPSRYGGYPMLDFPTAWRLCHRGLIHKTWRCSYVQADRSLLCDCGAVEEEFNRIYDRRRDA